LNQVVFDQVVEESELLHALQMSWSEQGDPSSGRVLPADEITINSLKAREKKNVKENKRGKMSVESGNMRATREKECFCVHR